MTSNAHLVPSIRNKQITLYLEKETPGAARYVQVDQSGEPINQYDEGAVFPTVYLRKKALKSIFGTNHIPLCMNINLSLEE